MTPNEHGFLPQNETIKFREYLVLIYKNTVLSHLLRFFLNVIDRHKGIHSVFHLNKGELFIIHLNHTINIHEISNMKNPSLERFYMFSLHQTHTRALGSNWHDNV